MRDARLEYHKRNEFIVVDNSGIYTAEIIFIVISDGKTGLHKFLAAPGRSCLRLEYETEFSFQVAHAFMLDDNGRKPDLLPNAVGEYLACKLAMELDR